MTDTTPTADEARNLDETRRPWRRWLLDHTDPAAIDYDAVDVVADALAAAGVPVPADNPEGQSRPN